MTAFPPPAGGELPTPQPECQSTDPLPARIGQHLRHYAMGHGRSHLHQCDHHRRLAAGDQRRQDIRSRQLFHHRRQHRPQQDRLPGQQRAWLHLSRSLRRPQRRHPRHRTDHPYRRQSRLYSPVSLDAKNTYYGLYLNDTFDITNRLSLTAGGRYNLAQIAMARSARHQPRPQRAIHASSVSIRWSA